jgi:hypothetical protein
MFARSFCLALLALACAAPAAHADTLGDNYVPDYDAADGVTIGHSGETRIPYIHFGAKAAKLYRTIAGKRVTVGCGTVTPEPAEGPLSSTGFGSTGVTLSKKRTRLSLMRASEDSELCVIASKRTKSDRTCLPLSASDEKQCARVIVAMTDSGRAYLDEKKRAIELLVVPTIQALATGKDAEKVNRVLAPYVVSLPDPDAAPPVGKVGYWTQGADAVYAAMLANGTRVFYGLRGGVFSTNLKAFMGPNDDAFSIF